MPDEVDISGTIKHYLSYKRPGRGFTEVSFFGGNFLGLAPKDIHRFLKAAAAFVSAGKIDGIRFSTRPDTIDDQRLEIIARYPVTTVELGVQSMDDGLLKALQRGHTAADTLRAAAMLKQTTSRLGCQIMAGLPGEKEAGAIKSARAVAELRPDFVRIYPLVVLAKSHLAALYMAKKFTPLDLETCIRRVKKLYLIFAEQSIPVIRMGLQASPALDEPGTILAGPYHPSFGHMVLSSLMLDRARILLNALAYIPEKVILRVNPGSVSRMQGLCKINIKKLKDEYPGIKNICICPDDSKTMDEVTLTAL